MKTEDMIRELENVARKYDGKPVFTGETNIPMMCREVAKRLEELSQPKTDWIPYTTNGELPCNGQKVWISFTNEVCSYVKQAWWIYDHFEWDNAKRVKDCPTAWMPYIVPQPYKKEGAEDESN